MLRYSLSEAELAARIERAVDAVLERLDTVPFAQFTANYQIVTRLGDITSASTVVQADSSRRSITINRVRYLIDGATVATCNLDEGECEAALNDARVSRYFPSGFSELPPIPPQTTNSLPDNVLPSNHALPVPGEQLQTAEITTPRDTVEVVNNPTNVRLDLRGVEVAFTLRVYY